MSFIGAVSGTMASVDVNEPCYCMGIIEYRIGEVLKLDDKVKSPAQDRFPSLSCADFFPSAMDQKTGGYI